MVSLGKVGSLLWWPEFKAIFFFYSVDLSKYAKLQMCKYFLKITKLKNICFYVFILLFIVEKLNIALNGTNVE